MANLDNSSSVQQMIEEAVSRGIERGVREATGVSRPGVSARTHSSSGNIAGIVGRAQDLLRSNAISIGNSVSTSLSSGPKCRRIGHNYTGKGKAPQPTCKIFELTCIDYADPCGFTDKDGNIPTVIPSYTLGKDEVLFSGTVELVSNDCESQIRSKLVDVLKPRIPGILTSDFSFVKVSRKTVSEPACRLDQN